VTAPRNGGGFGGFGDATPSFSGAGPFPRQACVFCVVPVGAQMALDFFAVGLGLWLQRGGPANAPTDTPLGEDYYESRNTPDQDAVIQWAKEAKQKGELTKEDAKALQELAEESRVPHHPPVGQTETHQNRAGPASKIPHIPVKQNP